MSYNALALTIVISSPEQEHETLMTVQVNITPNGRMSLPADIRKRLGLTGGGAVLLEETADGVVLRTAAQAVARAQAISKALTAGRKETSVDEFLADRLGEWPEE